ncbi:uncharacterized protein LOC135696895 [Ochlerotatus camptorhynchus]|uniref:uncharacterized protein LOC135696895 n=1 Tax=Ochlerotatus camptorhynchus TaxID=644619 RepID=UPI0031DF9B87
MVLISDSILELSAPWLVRNSGSEMRNEAISLALMLVVAAMLVPIGQGAVDIFSGMAAGDGKNKEQPEPVQEDLEDVHLQTCVTDVYAEEPIKFDEKLLSLSTMGNAIKEIPKPPAMPSLKQTLSRFTNVFQLPRFSEMGQELKAIIGGIRAIVDVYIQQWMGFFRKRHRETVGKMKASVQQMNRQIRDSFANHFAEFKDVCLSDSNRCLQSIQKSVEGYDKRLNKNMAACNEFAERQVNQHDRWVGHEAKLLERPLLRLEGCFGEGHVGISLASCVGNMVSNTMKAATDGLKRFSEAMGTASTSLENRLGKFQECVVNRKKLLDRGQTRIAERAKQCLRKQSTEEGEIFGGDHGDEF